jgi:hypothetical protein
MEAAMSRRAVILAASLLAITCMGSDSTSAQANRQSFIGDPLALVQPIVLAGPDVGFRVIRMDGSIPVGQIVVRINGAWVAAETSK